MADVFVLASSAKIGRRLQVAIPFPLSVTRSGDPQPRPEAGVFDPVGYDLMLCVGSKVLQMLMWSEVELLPMIGLRNREIGKSFRQK